VGALLALASALFYGLSDFLGGVLSRRASFLWVTMVGQIGALASMALVGPLVSRTVPQIVDLAWGAVSGVGTGLAMIFLYRGMSRGAMSIVVPISAVGGVAMSVLVGVAFLAESPTPLAWSGIVLSVPALWSVSRRPAGENAWTQGTVGDGLISSAGIALQYLALAEAGLESGIWPVVAGRVTSVVSVAVLGRSLWAGGRGPSRRVERGSGLLWAAAFAGALAGVALLCFLLATGTQLVSVAVVLSSLYPVIPVLLGVTVLRERLGRRQVGGLAAALVATVLITMA
jgi:drug/metabolite transporter (DMT)-like permease